MSGPTELKSKKRPATAPATADGDDDTAHTPHKSLRVTTEGSAQTQAQAQARPRVEVVKLTVPAVKIKRERDVGAEAEAGASRPPLPPITWEAAVRVSRMSSGSSRGGGGGGGGSVSRAPQEKFMPLLPSPDADFEITVQNLVFTGVLGTIMRLRHVAAALACHGAELNQKRFSAVILRTHLSAQSGEFDEDVLLQQLRKVSVVRPRLDKIAILIFRNGNLVCTGAKTFSQARYMLQKTAAMLQAIGYQGAVIKRLNIMNMVGRAQLPCRIDRARMAREIPAFASYDPLHFPGVTLKHPLLGLITLLVFDSGRVVVTGTRSKPVADAALRRIKPLLVHFDVNTPPGTRLPDISAPAVSETALYDILGVAPTATKKEITTAYKKKALKLHPDKNAHLAPQSVEYRSTVAEFKRVKAAHDLLCDRERRDAYDFTGAGREVIDIDIEDDTGEYTDGTGAGDADAAADVDLGEDLDAFLNTICAELDAEADARVDADY